MNTEKGSVNNRRRITLYVCQILFYHNFLMDILPHVRTSIDTLGRSIWKTGKIRYRNLCNGNICPNTFFNNASIFPRPFWKKWQYRRWWNLSLYIYTYINSELRERESERLVSLSHFCSFERSPLLTTREGKGGQQRIARVGIWFTARVKLNERGRLYQSTERHFRDGDFLSKRYLWQENINFFMYLHTE